MLIIIMNNMNVFHPLRGVYTKNLVNLKNIWKQQKKFKTRYKKLRKLGLNHYQSLKFENTSKGYWRRTNSATLKTTLTN